MHAAVGDLFKTSTFWSGVLGWTAASACKIVIDLRITGRIDFRYLASLGGMPSAHSALVSAVATSVGLVEGFGSTIFVVSLAFAIVVMFDASTVRRATGLQARLLNQIVDEVYQEHHLSTQRLKEILGHTRKEVFVGMLVGIAVAVIVNLLMK
jgi:hypothetical protein